MEQINVQFSDSTQDKIIASFSCEQNESDYPNQGGIQSDDPRWKDFYNTIPDAIRLYVVAPS